MPIDLRCPSCRAQFNLDESLRGKMVRCKQCSEVFVVAETPQAVPQPAVEPAGREREGAITTQVRAAAGWEWKRPEPVGRIDNPSSLTLAPRSPGRSSAVVYLMLACLATGVALMIGSGPAGLWGSATPAPDPPPAQARPAAPNPQPDHPPVAEGALPAKPDDLPPGIVPWRVTIDPPAQPLRPPADLGKSIPGLQSDPLLFPTRASSFVAIGKNTSARDTRQVWNLETMQQVGTITGQLPLLEPVVLSPDGKYLAGKVVTNGQATGVGVYSTATGKQVQRLTIEPAGTILTLADFAGPDQMLTIQVTGVKSRRAQLWDIPTGQAIKEFDLDGPPVDAKSCAVSPGGKFLAVIDTAGKLTVYDLAQGSNAGNAAPQWPAGLVQQCKGLAFSPDGVELAGLYYIRGDSPRLFVWDMARGRKPIRQIFLDKELNSKFNLSPSSPVRALDGIPDHNGWLLFGSILIDGESGATVWTVPAGLEPGTTSARRMLSPRHLALATGSGESRQLQIMTLHRERMRLGANGADGEPANQ